MRHLFGWDLPPGVTQRDIDEAAGAYDDPDESEFYYCYGCGQPESQCTCFNPELEPEPTDTEWDYYDLLAQEEADRLNWEATMHDDPCCSK